MSDGIRITGNWDFDSDKKVDSKSYDAKSAQQKLTTAFDGVNFSDGIDENEAMQIIEAFEGEDAIGFDDFDITDQDVRNFLGKKAGMKNVSNSDLMNMKSILKSVVNAFQKPNTSANISEGYKSIQDIYTTNGGQSVSLKPKDGLKTQNAVHNMHETDEANNGATLADMISKAYSDSIADICKQYGITDEKAVENFKNGVMSNAIDEYLQSNPELAGRIVEMYNQGVSDDKKVTDIKQLSKDQIAKVQLYNVNGATKEEQNFKVIVPSFNLPMPNKDGAVPLKTSVKQTQYSTDVNKASITADGTRDPENGKFASVEDAIASLYGLNKEDANYSSALNDILFQIANDPSNAELLETKINSLKKGEDFKNLTDAQRAELLKEMSNISELNLPDNVLVNSLQFAEGQYTYTQGGEIFQLSLKSGDTVLDDITLPENIKDAQITSLEDILKFSYDPRTGEALKTFDEKGNPILNIDDQAAQGLADAYMLNAIKDNPEIFAASQEINGQMSLFGAYDIDFDSFKDENGNVDPTVKQKVEAFLKEGKTTQDDLNKIRSELLGDQSIEDFLEAHGKLNLDNAKSIKFYDEDGNVRFKDADGKALKFNTSVTYVRFGTAKAAGDGNGGPGDKTTGTNTGTGIPTGTGTPTNTGTGVPTKTGTGIPTNTGTNTGTPTNTNTGTGIPTNTNTSTGTKVPTNTGTGVPTGTGTPTNTGTGVPTNTNTGTGTPKPTSTGSSTGTPTSTGTPKPTGNPGGNTDHKIPTGSGSGAEKPPTSTGTAKPTPTQATNTNAGCDTPILSDDKPTGVTTVTQNTTPASTGSASTGTVNTGTASTGTVNTGTASTGSANTGTASTGSASTGAPTINKEPISSGNTQGTSNGVNASTTVNEDKTAETTKQETSTIIGGGDEDAVANSGSGKESAASASYSASTVESVSESASADASSSDSHSAEDASSRSDDTSSASSSSGGGGSPVLDNDGPSGVSTDTDKERKEE